MHRHTSELPTVMESPDSTLQRATGFGDIDGLAIDVVRGSMGPGVDITPLLAGLEDDRCQVPHWGYIVAGSVRIRYSDGTEEVDEAGEVVYWPPGHTMSTEDDGVELVLFSPEDDHDEVFDHLEQVLEEMGAD